MRALQDYEDGLCAGCGQPRSISMDPGTDRLNRDDPRRWQAHLPHRCHSCRELDHRQAEYADEKDSSSLYFGTYLVDDGR